MTAPKVSVLVPAYNHESYVGETLASIAAQDYPNLEIVIVDDCSTDRTVEVIEAFIRQTPEVSVVFRQNEENRGAKATVNRALGLATGDYLIFFASDDLFLPGRLARQVEFMESHPEVRILFGNGWAEKSDGGRTPLHGSRVAELFSSAPSEILAYLYTHTSPIFMQTALVRRDLILEIGGHDEETLADDWHINTKIFGALEDRSEFAYIDEPAIVYRVHEENLHKNFDRQSNLKVQFVERYTPQHLRQEAFTNIHSALARQAFRNGLESHARHHAWRAIREGGRKSNLRQLLKILILGKSGRALRQ